VIQSWVGHAQQVFGGRCPKGFPANILAASQRKLRLVDAATTLEDLRIPPGNHLEALAGDRAGQHSIRINRQWRVCFTWRDGNAHGVEIVDHH
jgi:proteic killer suppression protein